MRRTFLISTGLIIATLAAFWPLHHAEFINFDDPVYVTNNENVFGGLTWHGVIWAFTAIRGGNWHPLTWLSHMLDCQLFGDKAGGHHLVNVGFHAANTVLLFLLLRRMTGAAWRSAFVAALFALHPLHVESVAWISERKDVLSTFFGLLALTTYVRYAEGRSAKVGERPHSALWYVMTLVWFCLGLMSKPMLVTLPFVMLLLDFWPLQRIYDLRYTIYESKDLQSEPQIEASSAPLASPTSRKSQIVYRKLLLEKLPFFGLSVLLSAVTFLAQKEGGAVINLQKMSLGDRLANASISYLEYLAKTFWPAKLAAYYPFGSRLPIIEALVAASVLIGITLLALMLARLAPYVAVGWLWFAGTLVPVIGLVQVGSQTMADRYSYLPLVGLFIAVVWGVEEITAGWRWQRLTLALSGGSILAACFICTQSQVKYWQNSIMLFSHTIQATGDNALAQQNLGHALSLAGRPDEAIEHLSEAIRIRPGYEQAYFNRGNQYGVQGKLEQAIADFREAVRYKPDYEQAYCNLGKALVLQGKMEEARTNFMEALRYKPDYAEAHTKLGNVLVLQGNFQDAREHLSAAVRVQPDYDEGQYYLGAALVRQGEYREASAHLRAAVKLKPDYASALNDLGWLLATCTDAQVRNVPEAIHCATRACELTGKADPMYLDTLAVAQSEAGQFAEAIALTQKAIREATTRGDSVTAAQLETHLNFYRAGRSYTQGVADSNPPNRR
jgi:protein O-mannosyl-transferase